MKDPPNDNDTHDARNLPSQQVIRFGAIVVVVVHSPLLSFRDAGGIVFHSFTTHNFRSGYLKNPPISNPRSDPKSVVRPTERIILRFPRPGWMQRPPTGGRPFIIDNTYAYIHVQSQIPTSKPVEYLYMYICMKRFSRGRGGRLYAYTVFLSVNVGVKNGPWPAAVCRHDPPKKGLVRGRRVPCHYISHGFEFLRSNGWYAYMCACVCVADVGTRTMTDIYIYIFVCAVEP